MSDEEAEAAYKSHGAVKIEKIRGLRVHRVKVPPQALEAIQGALAKRPEVKFVEPNRRLPLSLSANDTYYSLAWHLPRIAAPQAWDVSQGSSSVIIAVLDSGVQTTHPDLATKLTPGFNFVNNTTNTDDWQGHGTAVAGAAAAISNNGVGVTGIGWQNRIMPVTVADSAGFATYSAVANGLTWAADNGAKVANVSVGGVAASSTVTAAAQYALSKGMIVIAAAGNCGCFDSTPENPSIISVSATDQNDNLTSFSSRGNYVDISAPGTGIPTTAKGSSYLYGEGTSIASPVVAGVVALMRSAAGNLTPADIKTLLLANADDKGTAGWDTSFGYGRVNAYRAVAAATAATTSLATDSSAPTVSISSPSSGGTISGAVTVTATAADNSSVTAVDLFVNGAYYASDTGAPYSFFLDTTKLTNGGTTLYARASDPAGNTGTSATTSVTVDNVIDTTAPTVAISSLSISGKSTQQKLNVNVAATDNVAVTKVELYVDSKLASSLTSPPYGFSINLRSYSAGSHSAQAKAYDAKGNVGTSASAPFTK